MNAEQFRRVIDFENGLSGGDVCLARWTNSGYYFSGKVRVVRVFLFSFRVELLEKVGSTTCIASWSWPRSYPEGQSLTIPRVENNRWSACNRLEPMGGYQ